jgi:hypothetical protein
MMMLSDLEPVNLDDDDERHLWCCRRDKALCGVRLDPDDAVEDDDGADNAAELCESCWWKQAVGAPCGLFCRGPQWKWGR